MKKTLLCGNKYQLLSFFSNVKKVLKSDMQIAKCHGIIQTTKNMTSNENQINMQIENKHYII